MNGPDRPVPDAGTVLAIAPHPDDELIGAGGSLLLHAKAGRHVAVVHVVGREPTLTEELSEERYAAEIDLAARRLGVAEHFCLDAPSRDLLPRRELRIALAAAVRRLRPAVVYLPHADEGDREHRLVHELARDALWMASADFFPEAGPEPAPPPRLVLAYEVWTPMREFSHAVNISSVMAEKVHAMRAYASQLHHVPWDEALEGLARYRGAVAQGGGHAEVFGVLNLAHHEGLARHRG
ncbi:PIG-L deacetylase family protein [Streptomyces sp. NPDC054796]